MNYLQQTFTLKFEYSVFFTTQLFAPDGRGEEVHVLDIGLLKKAGAWLKKMVTDRDNSRHTH